MASILDVARLAGVSKSTVSRVINDEYGVKASTKIKVNQAIKSCGYLPNQIAKDLKSKTTNLIGVIVPRISSHATSLGVEGISHAIARSNKRMLLANTEQDAETECQYIQVFNQKRVDGIILFATHIDKQLVTAIKASQAPVVIIGQDASMYNIPSIVHDDVRVGAVAAEKLYKAGCKEIAFLGVSSRDIAVGQHRFEGLVQGLSLYDLKPAYHSYGDFSLTSGKEEMKKLLQENPRIDGVFCATDRIAAGAIQALHEQGKIAGKDIHIIGLGNGDIANVVMPRLSTFEFAFESAGEKAAEMLINIISNGQTDVAKLVLGFKWIAGQSCKIND